MELFHVLILILFFVVVSVQASSSQFPTFAPSLIPSRNPSAYPSSQPTSKPSIPTSKPSTRPSSQPSQHPSSQPTIQPTSIPSTQPTLLPSSLPSSQPSAQPSTQPTFEPTAVPTVTPNCPPGQKLIRLPHHSICQECPSGFVSAGGLNDRCSVCKPGYYAVANSSSCAACPLNTYQPSYASDQCIACGQGFITPLTASVSKADCINPINSFILGWIALGVSIVITWVYLYRGRLQQVAFERNFGIFHKLTINALAISQLADWVFDIYKTLESLEDEYVHRNKEARRKCFETTASITYVSFYIIIFLASLVTIALSIVFGMSKVLFSMLIVYNSFYTLIELPSTFKELARYCINEISEKLYFSSIWSTLCYPYYFITNELSFLKINLAAITVTCSGAQSPVYLLVDLVVIGVVIIFIRSDAQLYWIIAQNKIEIKLQSMILRGYGLKHDTYSVCVLFVLSLVLRSLPTPLTLIQYAISLITVSYFFQNDYYRSPSNPNCDNAASAPHDYLLSFATTTFVYLVIPPVVYLSAQILVPNFTYHHKLQNLVLIDDGNHDAQHKAKDNAKKESSYDWYCCAKSRSLECCVPQYHSSKTANDSKDGKDGNNYTINVIRRSLVHTLHFILSFAALDWIYFKLVGKVLDNIMEILKLICMIPIKTRLQQFKLLDDSKQRLVRNMVEEESESLEKNTMIEKGQVKYAQPLKIAWFASEFDKRTSQHPLWQEELSRAPNFQMFSGDVRSEMTAAVLVRMGLDDTSALKTPIEVVLTPFSYLILFQLLTQKGREVWYSVMHCYLTIVLIGSGVWTEKLDQGNDLCFLRLQYEKHGFIMEKMKVNLTGILDRVRSNIGEMDEMNYTSNSESTETERTKVMKDNNNSSHKKGQEDIAAFVANDRQLAFQSYISAFISVRILVLQIIPGFALFSNFAADVCQFPLFKPDIKKTRDQIMARINGTEYKEQNDSASNTAKVDEITGNDENATCCHDKLTKRLNPIINIICTVTPFIETFVNSFKHLVNCIQYVICAAMMNNTNRKRDAQQVSSDDAEMRTEANKDQNHAAAASASNNNAVNSMVDMLKKELSYFGIPEDGLVDRLKKLEDDDANWFSKLICYDAYSRAKNYWEKENVSWYHPLVISLTLYLFILHSQIIQYLFKFLPHILSTLVVLGGQQGFSDNPYFILTLYINSYLVAFIFLINGISSACYVSLLLYHFFYPPSIKYKDSITQLEELGMKKKDSSDDNENIYDSAPPTSEMNVSHHWNTYYDDDNVYSSVETIDATKKSTRIVSSVVYNNLIIDRTDDDDILL